MDDLLVPLLISAGLFLVVIFSGLWIGFGLAGVSIFMYIFLMGKSGSTFAYTIYNSINSFDLLALPLYILMGEILLRGGLSKKLYDGMAPLFNRIPGGLLHTNVASCAIFASVCGSTVATTAAIATIAVPELTSRGYDKRAAYGSLAAAGPLGATIPPSISYIIFGVLAQVSIGKMFIAGIVPGLLLAIALMVVIIIWAKVNPRLAPVEKKASFLDTIRGIISIFPIVILIVIVWITIYFGIATATEAASFGVLGALAVSYIFGTLNWKGIKESAFATVKLNAIIVFVLIAALSFGYALAYLGVAEAFSKVMIAMPGTPLMKIFGIWIMYAVLGMFLDGTSMKALTIPILLPFLVSMDIDLIWFGVGQTILTDLGNITPPFGLALYTVQSVTGDKFSTIVRGTVPFYWALLAVIIILTLFPEITLWLPRLMA